MLDNYKLTKVQTTCCSFFNKIIIFHTKKFPKNNKLFYSNKNHNHLQTSFYLFYVLDGVISFLNKHNLIQDKYCYLAFNSLSKYSFSLVQCIYCFYSILWTAQSYNTY